MTRIENGGSLNREYAQQMQERMQESEKARKAEFAKIDKIQDDTVKQNEKSMDHSKEIKNKDEEERQQARLDKNRGVNIDTMA